jgi:hypothetical protein
MPPRDFNDVQVWIWTSSPNRQTGFNKLVLIKPKLPCSSPIITIWITIKYLCTLLFSLSRLIKHLFVAFILFEQKLGVNYNTWPWLTLMNTLRSQFGEPPRAWIYLVTTLFSAGAHGNEHSLLVRCKKSPLPLRLFGTAFDERWDEKENALVELLTNKLTVIACFIT